MIFLPRPFTRGDVTFPADHSLQFLTMSFIHIYEKQSKKKKKKKSVRKKER